MNRRRFLSGAGSTLAVAGCLSRGGGGDAGGGTEDLPVRFWLESASPSETASLDPIVFADLTADEREIVEAALEAGEYTVESGAESAPLERLRDRIERRTGNGETLEAYLRRGESWYRIGFADGDHIVAHPDQ